MNQQRSPTHVSNLLLDAEFEPTTEVISLGTSTLICFVSGSCSRKVLTIELIELIVSSCSCSVAVGNVCTMHEVRVHAAMAYTEGESP